MKNVKIVLVAEWDGWCGACAAERPLVLTRTGRQRLRTWLAAAADDSRPLVLSCRLCGTGVDVPLERDDPPVSVTAQDPERLPTEPVVLAEAPTDVLQPVALPTEQQQPQVPDAEASAGRQVVAQALGALLRQRTAAAGVLPPPPVAPLRTVQVAPAVTGAPVLPLQRDPSSGGLAELQLLADGIDLLSTRRA